MIPALPYYSIPGLTSSTISVGSGGMNRQQIRNQVRTMLNEETPGFWTDTALNGYINLSLQHLSSIISAMKEDFFTVSSTFQCIQGVKSYLQPADCRFIRRMEIYRPSDPGFIQKLDQVHFPRTEARGQWPYYASSQPSGYTVTGNQFNLLPIPDQVYDMRIYYDQRQSSLATDSEVALIPPDFNDMLVYWTIVLALLQNGDDPKVFIDLFNSRKSDLLETMISHGGDDPNAVEGYLESY